MTSYLRRLLRTGAAYQLADAVSKLVALALLPVYTRHLTRADYGTAELLLTTIILFSIVLRLGLGEAFVRFHYLDADPERRRRLARTATGSLFVVTTRRGRRRRARRGADLARAARRLAARRGPRRRARPVGLHQPRARLRAAARRGARAGVRDRLADQRRRSRSALTLWLVVGRDEGALGLLLGNYVASAVVLVGLWWSRARRVRPAAAAGSSAPSSARCCASGCRPSPPRSPSSLLFFVDRFWLYRFESADEAGLYSLSVKLAGIVVFTVRAFQYAWPPLAYSIVDDAEASRVYARITTYYVLFTGIVVAGLVLLGRWLVRLFAAPEFFEAHEALPWVSLGWALYGLFLVLVAMAGRAQVTVRNAPAALCGLIVNVALLALLVAAAGDRRRRPRARRRLRRDAGRDVGADPQPVPGRVRVGAAGALHARRRRDRGRGRAAAADRRRRGLRHPRAGAGGDPARPLGRALLPAGRAARRPRACSGGRCPSTGG